MYQVGTGHTASKDPKSYIPPPPPPPLLLQVDWDSQRGGMDGLSCGGNKMADVLECVTNRFVEKAANLLQHAKQREAAGPVWTTAAATAGGGGDGSGRLAGGEQRLLPVRQLATRLG
jgi:hypothetical protein